MFEDEIKKLNDNVTKAIAERTSFLDSKMDEVAKVKIGQEAFELDTGRSLGTVVEYYRYWANQNPLLDDSLNISYRFNNGSNTSSQPGLIFGTIDDLVKYKERELSFIKSRQKV